MQGVTLSKAVRQNLQAMQSTAKMMSETQNHLATGKKVNSALDNPTNFFTASSLNSRANDMGNLMDSVGNAVQTLQAADNGLKAITKLVEAAQGTARQAQQASKETPAVAAVAAVAAVTAVPEVVGVTGVTGVEGSLTASNNQAAFVSAGIPTSGQDFTISSSSGASLTITSGGGDTDTLTKIAALIDADAGFSATVDGGTGLMTITDADTGENVTATSGGFDVSNLGLTSATASSNAVTAVTAVTAVAAVDAVDAVDEVVAAAAVPSETRQNLLKEYNNLLKQIDQLTNDASFNGNNFLKGDDLKVTFNEDSSSSLSIKGVDVTSSGLSLAAEGEGNFQDNTKIEATLKGLDSAMETLRSTSSTFGSSLSVVQTRQEFTENMINTLEEGASNLTMADLNEEGANMLALQTRQSLATTAMSMASRADQSVLSLLR
ncbi:MAG: flagellin [Hyphomicrobiales bacterium]